MGSAKYKGCFCLFWIFVFATEISAKVGFNTKNEYQYEYTGQVTVGLPNVANDRSAVRITTTVVIQPDKNDIVAQFKDVKLQNGFVKDGRKNSEDINNLPQQPMQPELGYPFKILYESNSDEFKGIEVTQKDPAWSVDIKKAFAVFFHVRLDQPVSKRQGYFANFKTAANFEPFEVTESGIEGECTTKYIYQDLPWPGKPHLNVLNVTKVRDLESCRNRPVWRQSIRELLKCASCQSTYESIKTEALISYYDVFEENGQYVLQNAESYGKVFITPNPPEGDKIKIAQFQSLKLQSIRPSYGRGNFQGTGISHNIMAIAPEEIKMTARFRRQTKTVGEKRPSRILESKDKLKIHKENIDDLIKNLQNVSSLQNVFKTIPRQIDLIRELSYEDIQEIYNSVEKNPEKRKLFINLILLSGTDASILFIKYLLEQRKITGEYAASIISQIPNYILEPQPGILEEIWSLCKGSLKNDNRQVYVSTLLAFGELVNQACVPKEKPKTVKPFHVKVSGCPESLKSRYLDELFNLFDRTDQMWEKSAITNVIYRMALNETLDYLIPYLQGKIFDLPSGLRTELLVTLFETGPGRQKEVAKYLSPIFYNVSLTTEERAIAFELLVYTTTSQELVNQLAMSTWKEPNTELARYIYSALKATKDVKIACWQPFAIRSSRAIKLAKPFPDSFLNSRMKSFSKFSEKISSGAFISHAQIFSPRFLFPKLSWYFIGNEELGYYFPNIEVVSINEGIQRVLDHLIGPKADFVENINLRDLFKFNVEQPETNTRHYENITFKVSPREDEPFNTRISFSMDGTQHRLFFLDEHTLNDFRNSGFLPPNKDLYSSLSDGIEINHRHIYLKDDTKLKFASSIGIPLTVEFVAPRYVDIQGKISLEASKTGISNALSTFQIKPQLQFTAAEYGRVSVLIELPNNKFIGTSAMEQFFITAPFNGYIKADLTQKSFSGSLLISSTGKHGIPSVGFNFERIPKLIHFETNPSTGKYQIKEHILHNPDTSQSYGKPEEFKSKLSIFNLFDLDYYPKDFSPTTFYFYLDDLGVEHIEWDVNWKHSPSPYEEQLFRGKSFLERFRLWNIIPEWTAFPESCKDISPPARIETATEPPKKRSWFSRFKDKVKSTFGRSGGDSVEEDYDDDDDDKKKEDPGRALHPHIVTGESDHRSGTESRSSLSSSGSQSRSVSGSSSYGSTSYGTGYGHGQSHYGQTTQEGSDYDWEQKSGSGGEFTQQTTGRGQGQFGGSLYGYDRLKGKKAHISTLKFKDETSITLIHFKLAFMGATKRQIISDITVNSNAAQGTKKVSAVTDFQNLFKHPHSGKVCFSGEYSKGFANCPDKGLTYPSIDYKLYWGDSCQSKDHIFIKGTFNPGPDSQRLWQEYQRKCSDDLVLNYRECIKAYNKATSLTNIKYDIQYSTPLPKFLTYVDKAIEKYLRCSMSDYLVVDDTVSTEVGKISAEFRYNLNQSSVDILINKAALYSVPYTEYSPLLYPRSVATSYLSTVGNSLTNDKFVNKCLINLNGNIRTFNDVNYNYTLGECPHVIAKDCSSSNIFTVTASGHPTKKIQVEIQGHIIETSMGQSADKGAEFIVDGKKYTVQDGQLVVIRSQREEDRYLADVSITRTHATIKSPPLGLIVTFTSNSVIVDVSQFWKGKICGICGEVSGNQYMTFLGPDQCLYSDGASFARTYRLAGPHCGVRGPLLGKVQCLPTAPLRTTHHNYGSSAPSGGIYRGSSGSIGGGYDFRTTTPGYGDYHTGTRRGSSWSGGHSYGESGTGVHSEYSGGESGASRFEAGFPQRGSGSTFEFTTSGSVLHGGYPTDTRHESGSSGGYGGYGGSQSQTGRRSETGTYSGVSGGESASRFEFGSSGGFSSTGSGSSLDSSAVGGSSHTGHQTGTGHEFGTSQGSLYGSGSSGGYGGYGESQTGRRSETGTYSGVSGGQLASKFEFGSSGGFSSTGSGSTLDSSAAGGSSHTGHQTGTGHEFGTSQGSSYGDHRTGSWSETGSTGYHSGSWYSSRTSGTSGSSSYGGYESGGSYSGAVRGSTGFSTGSGSQFSQSTNEDAFPSQFSSQSHLSSQTSDGSHAGYGGQQHVDEDEHTGQVLTSWGSSSNVGGCYKERNLKTSRVEYTRAKQEDQTCFSTQPIQQCQSYCQAVDLIHKTVTFQCYLESSSVAKELSVNIEKGPLGILPQSSSIIEQDITLPEKCISRQ